MRTALSACVRAHFAAALPPLGWLLPPTRPPHRRDCEQPAGLPVVIAKDLLDQQREAVLEEATQVVSAGSRGGSRWHPTFSVTVLTCASCMQLQAIQVQPHSCCHATAPGGSSCCCLSDALVCDEAVLYDPARPPDGPWPVMLLLQNLTDGLEAGAVHLCLDHLRFAALLLWLHQTRSAPAVVAVMYSQATVLTL